MSLGEDSSEVLGKEIGRRIVLLRERQKLSQRALAKALEASPQKLHGWESGRRKPEGQSLLDLAKALNTSISYLFGETDDPRPAPDWHTDKGASTSNEAKKQEAARLLRQALETLES